MKERTTEMRGEVSTRGKSTGRAFERGYNRRFHYLNAQQRKDLATLRSLIRLRRGHMLLTGPGGTGKTTLLKRIIEECQAENTFVIQLHDPQGSFDSLLEALIKQVVPTATIPASRALRIRVMQNALLQLQRPVMICIDEAQTAPDEVLQGLLQLAGTNGTDGTVTVSLVLAGTEPIAERLADILKLPLADFMRMVITLAPLQADEVVAYIRHQLGAASIDENFFYPDVIERIVTLSGGVPSEVSSLCGLASYVANLEHSQRVTLDIVNQVSRESWIMPVARAAKEPVSNGPLVGEKESTVADYPLEAIADFDRSLDSADRSTSSENATSYAATNGRPSSQKKRWGWTTTLAVLLITGSLSYTFWWYLLKDEPKDTVAFFKISPQIISKVGSTDQNRATVGRERSVPNPRLFTSELRPEPWDYLAGAVLVEPAIPEMPEQQVAHGDGPSSIKETSVIESKSPDSASTPQLDPDVSGLDETGNPPESDRDSTSKIDTSEYPQLAAAQFDDNIQRQPLSNPVTTITPETPRKTPLREVAPTPRVTTQFPQVGQLDGIASLRKQPSARAFLLETLKLGDKVTVTARIAESNWYQVIDPFGERGYIYAELTGGEQSGPLFSITAPANELRLIPLDEAHASLLEVPALLQEAGQHLDADRLLAPRFNNALHLYREIERINPGNTHAEAGIRQIKSKLFEYSMDARKRGDLEAAKRILHKILVVDSTDQQARRLLEQLNQANGTTEGNELSKL